MSFIFGGNTPWTYDDIQRKRALASQLAMGVGSPRNVGEGLSAIGKALAVRGIERRASRRDAELQADADEKWSAFESILNSLGGGAPMATPYGSGASNAPAADYMETVPTAPAVSTTNLDTGEATSGITPLTPDVPTYSPEDRIELARTIQAEAANQGLEGMVAVGSVIRNRVQSPDFGSTYQEVQMAPGQFSPRNSQTGYAGGEQGQNMNFMPNEDALRAADIVLAGGADPTGGATHFFNPAISNPSWARGANFKPIGDHVFGSVSAPSSGGRAGVSGGRTSSGGQAALPAIAAAMGDPYIRRDPGKMAILNAMLGQALTPPERMTPYQQAQLDMRRQEVEMRRAEIERKNATAGGPDFDTEAKLRGEFTGLPSVKDFSKVNDAWSRVQASAEDPSPAGDMALIFNYMKMLDPGSTVREGEFATAEQAGSVDDRVVSLYNRILSGTRLSDSQREDFLNRAGRLFNAQASNYNQKAERYQSLARQYNVDPFRVAELVDLYDMTPKEAAEVAAGEGGIMSVEEAESLLLGE